MNYHTVYYQIINRAKSRDLAPNVYSEKHHIIPRSLGGTNFNDNLVNLTAREHFLCHMLLVKMHTGKEKYKMLYAINGMQRNNQYQCRQTSRMYDYFRQQFAEMKRHDMLNNNPMTNPDARIAHSQAMATRKSRGMTGKKHSDTTREKMRVSRARQTITDETKRKLSNYRKKESLNPDYVNGCRIGWYITPWGRFKSLTLAAEGMPCTRISIKNWCRINNNKSLTMHTAKSNTLFNITDAGKTFAELGFGFEEL